MMYMNVINNNEIQTLQYRMYMKVIGNQKQTIQYYVREGKEKHCSTKQTLMSTKVTDNFDENLL